MATLHGEYVSSHPNSNKVLDELVSNPEAFDFVSDPGCNFPPDDSQLVGVLGLSYGPAGSGLNETLLMQDSSREARLFFWEQYREMRLKTEPKTETKRLSTETLIRGRIARVSRQTTLIGGFTVEAVDNQPVSSIFAAKAIDDHILETMRQAGMQLRDLALEHIAGAAQTLGLSVDQLKNIGKLQSDVITLSPKITGLAMALVHYELPSPQEVGELLGLRTLFRINPLGGLVRRRL